VPGTGTGTGGAVRRLLVLLATCCAGCTSFQFTQQDVFLTHDAAADVLELAIVYHGVHARRGEGDALEAAARSVRRIASGERYVLLFGWPFELDIETARAEPASEPLGPCEQRAWDLLAALEVAQAGFFAGADERLGVWQRVRLPRAGELVALVNEWIALGMAEPAAGFARGDPRSPSPSPVLDDASRRRCLEWVRDGTPWILLRDGGLEVRCPMSPAAAARWLASIVSEAAERPDEAQPFRALLESLTEIELEGGVLALFFGPRAGGGVLLRIPRADWEWAPGIEALLRRDGGLEGRVPELPAQLVLGD